jgi:ClpP class serine protease
MSTQPALRAYTTLTSLDWAMTEDYLDIFVAVALRENDPIEAVERRLGRPLNNARSVTVRDGVATIPVLGPIFRYADFFTMISGGVTVETLAQDLTAALDDPAVRSIVLHIDSPGGEVNGMHELADMVYAARDTKPITAYVGYLGASGGYWLASAAGRVVVDATAMLGSIGVVSVVRDPTKIASKDLEFVSSQSPHKRSDPTTDAGRAAIQARIDALAEVFIADVARNRGTSVATVAESFGQGRLLVGAAAVAAGMADALGSYEGVIAALSAPAPSLFALPPIAAQRGKETPVTTEDPTRTAEAAQAAAELTQLRAQLASERQSRIAAEAEGFAERQIVSSKMLPGERAAWVALYAAVAADDVSSPRAGEKRTDLLAAAFGARPAHGLVSAPPTGPALGLPNQTETPTGGDSAALLKEADAHARAFATQRNGTRTK